MRQQLVAVLLLLAVACSGSVPKPELIARADTICAELNDQTASLEQPEPNDPAGLGSYLESRHGLMSEAVDEIKAIGGPEEDGEVYDEMLEWLDEGLTKLDEAVTAIRNQDDAAADAALNAAFGAIEQANARAGEFGFEDCAE